MVKVAKFGGSSVAGAQQFQKVKAIVEADPARKVVVVSAAGKRSSGDHKLTDLLYLCHAHLTYGVSCDDIVHTIEQRLCQIRDELDLRFDVGAEMARLEQCLSKEALYCLSTCHLLDHLEIFLTAQKKLIGNLRILDIPQVETMSI